MSTHRIEIAPELFKTRLFPPHGRFSASGEGQLVHMDATGPFNAELMKIYIETVFPLLAEVHARGPMVTLVEYHESMVMSPETLLLLAEAVRQSEQQELVSVAVAYAVAQEVEGRDFMIPKIARQVFGDSQCRFQAFTDVASARAWLNAELADHRPLPGTP